MYRDEQIRLRSDAFPGGTLLEAYFDRDVVRLSDRGLASNMIGDRWSDIVGDEINEWPGQTISAGNGEPVLVTHVVRLDDIPSIARIASKRKLQNPDFIVAGTTQGKHVLFAADAKYSVETAKQSQVSAETLSALLDVGPLITELIPDIDIENAVLNGIFVSPDYPLTSYMMARTRGYRSVSVPRQQFHLVPLTPLAFLGPLSGARLIAVLAGIDGLEPETRSNVLLATYYFRLVRACIGCWLDQTDPVLGPRDRGSIRLAEVEDAIRLDARKAQTSWHVVEAWDARAELVRRQRDAINTAMQLPMPNRELREAVMRAAAATGGTPPSLNRVRKAIGSWYSGEIIDRVGVVLPPVSDLPSLLLRIETIARDLGPELQVRIPEIISEQLRAVRPDPEDS